MNINTVNDWMTKLAQAIIEYNDEMLEELEGISRGWLQPQDELEAQMDLIEAAWEAIER